MIECYRGHDRSHRSLCCHHRDFACLDKPSVAPSHIGYRQLEVSTDNTLSDIQLPPARSPSVVAKLPCPAIKSPSFRNTTLAQIAGHEASCHCICTHRAPEQHDHGEHPGSSPTLTPDRQAGSHLSARARTAAPPRAPHEQDPHARQTSRPAAGKPLKTWPTQLSPILLKPPQEARGRVQSLSYWCDTVADLALFLPLLSTKQLASPRCAERRARYSL